MSGNIHHILIILPERDLGWRSPLAQPSAAPPLQTFSEYPGAIYQFFMNEHKK